MWTRSLSSWLWGLSFVVVSGVGVHSVFAVFVGFYQGHITGVKRNGAIGIGYITGVWVFSIIT